MRSFVSLIGLLTVLLSGSLKAAWALDELPRPGFFYSMEDAAKDARKNFFDNAQALKNFADALEHAKNLEMAEPQKFKGFPDVVIAALEIDKFNQKANDWLKTRGIHIEFQEGVSNLEMADSLSKAISDISQVKATHGMSNSARVGKNLGLNIFVAADLERRSEMNGLFGEEIASRFPGYEGIAADDKGRIELSSDLPSEFALGFSNFKGRVRLPEVRDDETKWTLSLEGTKRAHLVKINHYSASGKALDSFVLPILGQDLPEEIRAKLQEVQELELKSFTRNFQTEASNDVESKSDRRVFVEFKENSSSTIAQGDIIATLGRAGNKTGSKTVKASRINEVSGADIQAANQFYITSAENIFDIYFERDTAFRAEFEKKLDQAQKRELRKMQREQERKLKEMERAQREELKRLQRAEDERQDEMEEAAEALFDGELINPEVKPEPCLDDAEAG